MALKIRLWQQGCTNRPSYRIVVADIRSPRDGKCIEVLGFFNPFVPKESDSLSLNANRFHYWLSVGAKASNTVMNLAKKQAPHVVQEYNAKCQAMKVKKTAKRRAK
jgi:small subunit ribosomal protein S16